MKARRPADLVTVSPSTAVVMTRPWSPASPRILRNTGSAKKAITAVARKLGIILWRIAIGPHVYTPGVTRIPKKVFEGMKQRAARKAAA